MIDVIKGSCIGTFHLKNQIPNQDYCGYVKKDDCVFACIADGVSLADSQGTISHAHFASKYICKFAVECFNNLYINKSQLYNDLLIIIYHMCKKKLEQYIKDHHLIENYYHSTFILTLYKEGYLYYCYIGDSGIIGFKNNNIFCITPKQKDGLFVDSILGNQKPLYGVVQVDGYILMTDGIYEAANRNYCSNGFDNRIINDLLFIGKEKRMIRFLNQLPEGYTNDDKTVVVVKETDRFAERFSEEPVSHEEYMKNFLNEIQNITF